MSRATLGKASGGCLALLIGNWGEVPPPTMARMLQRNNISTMPMPPFSNSRRNCSMGQRRDARQPQQVPGYLPVTAVCSGQSIAVSKWKLSTITACEGSSLSL